MRDRARDARRARPPGRVGAGVVRACLGGRLERFDRACLDCELGHRAPVVGLPRPGGGGPTSVRPLRRLRRNRFAEQISRGAGPDRHRSDGPPRWHARNNRVEQLAGVGGTGIAVDVDAGLGAALQQGEARVEPGAAPGIGAPVDGQGEDAARRRIEAAEGVGPGGIAGHAVRRDNRYQAPVGRQHRECRADMSQIGVVADPIDPRRRREGRVHQHDRRPDIVQPVRDGLRVEGGDDCLREEPRQEPRPGLRVFVEMKMASSARSERAFGHDGQHAGAGRGFQHGVAWPDRGGLEGGIGERQRRRELLQADLLLGAPGMRGLQRGDRVQHRQHPARPVRSGAGIAAHGPAVALEEQHGGGLGRLIGILPQPNA